MDRRRRTHHLHTPIAEQLAIQIVEQSLAAAEDHRGYGHMEIVNQSGAEVLLDRAGTAAEPDVLTVCCRGGVTEGRFDSVGHEVERRATFHDQWISRMVGEDEDRMVVRRVGSPPSVPCLLGPRA